MNERSEPGLPGLSVDRRCRDADLPGDGTIERIAAVALAGIEAPILGVSIVDEAEGRALNRRWRGRDHATNVLSFPASLPGGTGLDVLGDVVICAPVVEREAAGQGKPLDEHFAHLLIHGILHLRGRDHMSTDQAQAMEAEEIGMLARLGIGNPYVIDED